jgi:hypothetical protein
MADGRLCCRDACNENCYGDCPHSHV